MSMPTTCSEEVAPTGGIRGMFFVAATATSMVHAYITSSSADARVKALRELLTRTKNAHKETIDDILPHLPEIYANRADFKDMKKGSFTLSGLSSRLTILEDMVASGGLMRWSPLYLNNDIVILSGELRAAYNNTMKTTKAANGIIAELKKVGEPSKNRGGPEHKPLSDTPEPLVTNSAGRV